jgi:hypothetical protein
MKPPPPVTRTFTAPKLAHVPEVRGPVREPGLSANLCYARAPALANRLNVG